MRLTAQGVFEIADPVTGRGEFRCGIGVNPGFSRYVQQIRCRDVTVPMVGLRELWSPRGRTGCVLGGLRLRLENILPPCRH